MKSLNSRMAKHHEKFLAELFEGTASRGSGNQFAQQMDGRQSHHDQSTAWAWDGKSTMGGSLAVSRKMWKKAEEQSHGERPMIALRFYDTERCDVGLDLVVINAHDLAELLEAVR